tara:strand:- start:2577 stop:3161 length:585 start_codon:yes stop_codon:yes gene_type:complete
VRILIIAFLFSTQCFSQTCEEEARSKSYVVLSLKLHAYLQAKTAHRLNEHYDHQADQLYKKFQDEPDSLEYEDKEIALTTQKHKVMSDRLVISYEDPAMCEKDELMDLVYAYTREKSKLCESDDRYQELDDLKSELTDHNVDQCPSISNVTALYQSSLSEDALTLHPRDICLNIFSKMKKLVTECHEQAKKNAP